MNLTETEWIMPHSAERENSFQQEGEYIFLIKEHLASSWSGEFEGLSVTYTSTDETTISGFIPDQAALHGLLARIRDLNLTLISINRVEKTKPPKTHS